MLYTNTISDLKISNELLKKWQKIMNILSSLFNVPSALIMKAYNNKIEVLFKNDNNHNNPYILGNSAMLEHSGLYCEYVLRTKKMLYVKNALKDKKWSSNPDIKINMINYLGFPLCLNDDECFGTICVLDSKEREYSQTQIDLLNEFKNVIEEDLKQIISFKHLLNLEKMAALGTLVAGIAHEINTPLGISVTGITHLQEIINTLENKFKNDEMSLEDFSLFLATNKELSALIYTNLKKADSLIKSFKKISVDQSSQYKKEFNLKTYLDEIILSISSVIKKSNVDVKILCEENILVNISAGPFSQIISNLVLNSLTHAYKDGEKGEIIITCQKKKNSIIIIYKDDGKGIKKEYLNKIFDPFFTTNRKNGGSGLGLHIVHNIVTQALKGTINCDSQENKGLEFKIVLNDVFIK